MTYTADLPDAFLIRLQTIAEALGAKRRQMLAVMMSESGVRADAHNDGPPGAPDEKRYHASGLIQFMPATLRGLGWTQGHAAFRKLSAFEQLPFVHNYYAPHRGHLDTVGGLYVATFLPALVKHCGDPSFVLTAKDGPLGWAYGPNAVFDVNRDYAITVGELELAVARNCRGPRWSELASREAGVYVPSTDDDTVDLRTTFGIQRALERLGHDPGKLDGIPGPRTTAAVVAFQTARGLTPDGIVGPLTRSALGNAVTLEH